MAAYILTAWAEVMVRTRPDLLEFCQFIREQVEPVEAVKGAVGIPHALPVRFRCHVYTFPFHDVGLVSTHVRPPAWTPVEYYRDHWQWGGARPPVAEYWDITRYHEPHQTRVRAWVQLEWEEFAQYIVYPLRLYLPPSPWRLRPDTATIYYYQTQAHLARDVTQASNVWLGGLTNLYLTLCSRHPERLHPVRENVRWKEKFWTIG